MSDLGYLERLLDGAAVEWVPLGEVCVVKTGPNINKALIDQSPGPYPVINSGREPLGYFDQWNTENDPIGITSRGAGVGLVTWTNGRFFRGNLNYSCAPKKPSSLNTRFLYHFLLFSEAEIQSLATYQGIPALNASALKKLSIPIPCPEDPQKSLAIQGEIVRILDAFTALTAELTAELTARKTQYNHYRNQLLSFEGGEVEWKTLGEIASFTYGLAAKAQDFGDARFIRISDIDRNGQLIADLPKFVDLDKESKRYLLKKNDLLMARTGATFGKTMIFAEDYPAVFAGFLIKIDLESAINPKYYWHFAQSSFFWDQANALVSGGGQPQFNANALQSIKMPIPFPSAPERSLAEQTRIVAILDKFDTLTASLAEGLPREIALRTAQYEHYRNLLLSFPKGDKA